MIYLKSCDINEWVSLGQDEIILVHITYEKASAKKSLTKDIS